MVKFDPSISYSDEASEIFSKYRKLKEEQQKNERNRLSEPIGYATLKLDLLTEDMKERVEAFFEENKHDFEYSGEIITREYYRKYLSKHFGKCFLDQGLIDFFKVNPEHKFKVMAVHEGFAVVEIYSKAYIVPEEVLELVEKTGSVAVANELMVKTDNQLTLANDLENAKELIKKVSNFEDEAFAGQLAAINNLKAEMEAKITAMYEMQAKMMAELQSKIQLYEHELLIMRSDLTAFEYRNGLTVNFMNIHKGVNAPVHQPIIIHQKLIYLDEDLPRLTDLYDVDSGSLEVAIKNSPALLEHICPTSKGITFLKMRNSAGNYELENTVMKFIRNVMPNEVGVLIRNGENTWFTWLDSNDISLSTDSFTSKSSDEETSVSLLQSRYYLFNLIMGLIERNEILQLDHVPTNMFADPSIIWSSADSQIADSTYVELSKIIPILNRYSKADDPIYVLNSFADSAKYNGHYGGGHTERGRGDNALTDNTFVDKGLSKIKGIDYLSDFTYRFYVSGEKRSWWGDSKISPSLYIEEDEFINLKFLTSNLIDYYIHTKRIGKISNSGRYVDFSHMLPILFGIKKALEEQEKIDRLHIVAQDYDLNLLTSFKILHDVRVITPYQAKRYSKWIAGLNEEDKAYYQQLLLINDLGNVIRKPKVCAAITKPTLMDNEDRRERDTVDYSIFTIAEAGMNQRSIAISKEGWRTNYKTLTYSETELRYSYWNKASRIKTFSNQESLDKLLKNEIIYQEVMDRKSTKDFVLEDDGIENYFGEREWFLVDFFDREGNMELVKEVEEMNKALKEAKKQAKQK
ncbi:hypothetical protein [Streptococcus gallolyticus]|uniref:hypothetical protein n=1 Tax=Streptococcus gallolyticus TaxID=315405 RepID=UPI0022835238|nr:hypothetical protein [Streptococcus gallolyticus]MCY7187331.1 hypothetical protein [Streptococcus gallolyticus subsp. gallolyticus]